MVGLLRMILSLIFYSISGWMWWTRRRFFLFAWAKIVRIYTNNSLKWQLIQEKFSSKLPKRTWKSRLTRRIGLQRSLKLGRVVCASRPRPESVSTGHGRDCREKFWQFWPIRTKFAVPNTPSYPHSHENRADEAPKSSFLCDFSRKIRKKSNNFNTFSWKFVAIRTKNLFVLLRTNRKKSNTNANIFIKTGKFG